jgi:murein DD-endopeptidase MepM/ murein hydrolase activator NlpD
MVKKLIILIVIFSTFGIFISTPIARADGLEGNDKAFFVPNLNPSERIAQIKTKTETQKILKSASSSNTGLVSAKQQVVAVDPWRLPFVAKTRMYQTQGYFGPYSHQTVNAIDLNTNSGVIAAAKSGVIATLQFGGIYDGWCNSNTDCYNKGGIWRGNHIIINHSDGSSSYYLHLQPGTLQTGLYAGKYIEQGTPLATQGSTGYTCNATCTAPYDHLHFQVMKNGVSIPTSFDDCNYLSNQCDTNGYTITDNFYTSTNYPPGYSVNLQNQSFFLYSSGLSIKLTGIGRGDSLVLGNQNENVTSNWTWLTSGEIRGINDWCLSSGGPYDGIIINDCNGKDEQKWIKNVNKNIVNKANGQCWDSERGNTYGSRVYLWNCHGGSNQQWKFGNEGYPVQKLNEIQ